VRKLILGFAGALAVAVALAVAPVALAAGTCSAHFTNGNAIPTFSGGKWTMPQVTVYQCSPSDATDSIYVELEVSENGTYFTGPYNNMDVTHDTKGDTSFTVSFGPTEPCGAGDWYRAAMINNDTGGTHYSAVVKYDGCP
jgi:hypothetical protein